MPRKKVILVSSARFFIKNTDASCLSNFIFHAKLNFMKKDIHPTYYHDAKVICACGSTFITGSTKKELHVEICSNCHPFYTGKQKLVDTAGRVEKFKKRLATAETKGTKRISKKQKLAKKEAKRIAAKVEK